jgi:hypothetical protein
MHYRRILPKAGVHKFSKNLQVQPGNSRHQKGDMKQVPYWGPTTLGATVQNVVTGRPGAQDLRTPLLRYVIVKYKDIYSWNLMLKL